MKGKEMSAKKRRGGLSIVCLLFVGCGRASNAVVVTVQSENDTQYDYYCDGTVFFHQGPTPGLACNHRGATTLDQSRTVFPLEGVRWIAIERAE
jgi:hypothetical protein